MTSVNVAAITKLGSCKFKIAPRKLIAERPNKAPAPNPISVGFIPPGDAPGLIEMTMTPTVATRMAIAMGRVIGSPSSTSPNNATWIGSVLM